MIFYNELNEKEGLSKMFLAILYYKIGERESIFNTVWLIFF